MARSEYPCQLDVLPRALRAALSLFALSITLWATLAGTSLAQNTPAAHLREPIIGGPCEGCEGVFEGLPTVLSSATRLAPSGERGQPMIIDGIVRDTRGNAVRGIVVYAYHTDANGIYRPGTAAPGESARRHGVLRGWAVTDSVGHYRFITIRPGHYPNGKAPEHVHMHVIEPRCCTYWIDSINFTDDSILSAAERQMSERGRGGSGLTTPTRDQNGTWHVTRDIRLGYGVPGYADARQHH